MLIISFCRPQLFSFLANALIHFAFQTLGADGGSVISCHSLRHCAEGGRGLRRDGEKSTLTECCCGSVTGRILTSRTRPQAKVIVFLGSVKWSCDPGAARLSAPTDLCSRLGGLAVLEDADEILLSLGKALEENWNYNMVTRYSELVDLGPPVSPDY